MQKPIDILYQSKKAGIQQRQNDYTDYYLKETALGKQASPIRERIKTKRE